MGNLARRPFTEMFEVAQNELVREAASNQEDKFKGFINQVYMMDLPAVLPEKYLATEAFITLLGQETAGTVTVGTGITGAKGAGTSWSSAHNNYLFKVDGYNQIYRATYSADTLLLFQNNLTWVEASGTAKSYFLFQDRYALPSDFNYMIADDPEDPCVVSRKINGSPVFLDPLENEEFDRQFCGNIGDIWAYTVKWVNATPYFFTLNAPSVADILRYFYMPQLNTLTEYTTGTVTFATTTAVLAAGGALWSANVNTALGTFYIRNDADGTGSSSRWYPITSITNDTVMTLGAAFGGTTGSGQTYTISAISKWPARFDDAILYGTALIADPDNLQVKKWMTLYENAISMDRTVEGKRATIRPLKEFFGKRGK